VQYKSGWVFEQNIKINVNIYKCQPIRGSSYIELPEIIERRQACINIKKKPHICPFCCKSYQQKEKLLDHLKQGRFKFGERSMLPSADDSINYVQSMKKLLKKPFVIYADFESILTKF